MSGPLAALLLIVAAAATAQHGLENPSAAQTYDEYYIDAVTAYSQNKWKEAIPFFRHAVEDYNRIVEARRKCFAKCAGDARIPHEYTLNGELMLFFSVVQRGACIERCREDFVGARAVSATPSFIEQKMKSKEAYNYLQLALYREDRIKEAAKDCSTFAYHNPFNGHIKANIQFYTTHPNVSEEDMEPLHSLPYRDLHNEGNRLYHLHQWEEMITVFEQALKEFYTAWEECRLLCAGPLRYSYDMDLAQAMSTLYGSVLECRTKCVGKMGKWRYDRSEDFFGSFFHYLQHGYYALDNSKAAAQASATHARVEPGSEVAKRNAVFYRQLEGITRKEFVPREDALPMVEKLENELDILRLLDEVSGHVISKMEAGDGKVEDDQQDSDEFLLELDYQRYPVGSHTLEMEEIEPVVVQLTNESGAERVVLDEVLTQKQCDLLIELASHGKEGDGYDRKSPHTTREKFEGLHVLDAAKKASEGEVNRTISKLYVDASVRVRDLVASHFKLETPLYFSYTHLVCRTALEGLQDGRGDLSHPVHSDNCVLDEALGECFKVPPAYTWRDYSAILYLNGDIEGGRFFFAHSPKDRSPEMYVDPKCGRAVGFSAGKENMHGVTAVTGGKRCAVALWFTLDPQHREATFDTAENILNGIST